MCMHTVIMPSAVMAPANTVRRGCLMAMMAAIMNVSSPSSVTRICARGETKQPQKVHEVEQRGPMNRKH